MALVAHRMMLSARTRRTHQQVARNKVGVLLVPSVADYYGRETDQPPPQQQQLANLWYYGIEPAAYVEVKSSYLSPSHLQLQLLSSMDNTKEQQLAGQEVNKIISQAALEHEKKKQQWFMQAQTQNVDPSKAKENNKKTNQNASEAPYKV
ncbi:uncharacterized protein Dmoj_GI19879 [Drosophila mojavensis]|uniref:Uncharacterized protein n=1 Tax=Drosophila mojavensis TaxID=7230 RepID=B4KIF7_DROMO|nr:uncharacterized protein Dmoj_GI19879 [Drosophila mojavensis]